MRVRFWRRSPFLSDSSTASKTAESSAIAGVSPPPWVERTDRRASRFALLAKIAAWSVVFGIVLEDWDILGIAWKHHFPYLMREAAGGLIVAIAIALEIRFSSLEASAERKIRDWYALRVAELNLQLEQLKQDNLTLEAELSPRLFKEQQDAIDRLKAFAGTRAVLEYVTDFECKRTAEQIAFVLSEAQWQYSPMPNMDPDAFFREGIEVGGNTINRPFAVKALIDELNRTGLDAGRLPGTGNTVMTTSGPLMVPDGSVFIRVGMKPSPQEKREAKPMTDFMKATNEALDEAHRSGRLPQMPDPKLFFKEAGRHLGGNRVPLPNR